MTGAATLVADIGGTHCRLAVCRDAYSDPQHVGVEKVAHWERPAQAIRHWWQERGNGPLPRRAVLAVAGPVTRRGPHYQCVMTNCDWSFDSEEIATELGIERVLLINDFHAAALGTLAAPEDAVDSLGGPARAPQGPRAILGAGTGLGVAWLGWSEGRPLILPGEGGHVGFAPRGPEQRELCGWLEEVLPHHRASWEDLLSGTGLARLYRFQRERHGGAPVPPEVDGAAWVSARGLDGACATARRTLELFAELYGAFAGDLGITVAARGGVWIAGGIAPRLRAVLCEGDRMWRAFTDRGVRAPLASTLPLLLCHDRWLGLRGCALAAE